MSSFVRLVQENIPRVGTLYFVSVRFDGEADVSSPSDLFAVRFEATEY